jgi:hypothetical protein
MDTSLLPPSGLLQILRLTPLRSCIPKPVERIGNAMLDFLLHFDPVQVGQVHLLELSLEEQGE